MPPACAALIPAGASSTTTHCPGVTPTFAAPPTVANGARRKSPNQRGHHRDQTAPRRTSTPSSGSSEHNVGRTPAVSSRGEQTRASGLFDCVVRQREPLYSGSGALRHFLHAGKARDDGRERVEA